MLLKRRIESFLILFVLLTAVGPLSAQPTVHLDSLFSRSIGTWLHYSLLLPDGYHRSKERYPVVYLLHGFNQDQTSWFVSSELVRYAAAYRFIIIAPGFGNSWYANSAEQPMRRYEDAFIADLLPHVDSLYRTDPSRDARSIAGLSMGGYGALKFGVKYPQHFGFAAGLSPSIQFPAGLEDSAIVARRSAASNASVRAAFGAARTPEWDEQIIPLLVERAASSATPYLFLSSGSSDNIPEVPIQMHQLAHQLRRKKIRFEMHESPGGHDWKFWDAEIEKVLGIIARRTL